jgi:hypothetical protein
MADGGTATDRRPGGGFHSPPFQNRVSPHVRSERGRLTKGVGLGSARANVRASVKVGRHPALVYRYKIGQKELHLNKNRCKKYIQKSLENRNPRTKNLLNQQVFKSCGQLQGYLALPHWGAGPGSAKSNLIAHARVEDGKYNTNN